MIEVLEIREGNFEFSDAFADQDRRQKLFYKQIFIVGSIVLLIFQTILILQSIPLWLRIVLSLMIVASLSIFIYFAYQYHKELSEEISGFILLFDESKEVVAIRVRKWVIGKYSDFIEEEVRFNQSIGFQAIIDEEGDIVVELIVDPEFPGSPIFKTYDIATLAECILLMQKVLPNMDKWYYKSVDVEEWSSELKIELNHEMQLARVPWLIRKYYGF